MRVDIIFIELNGHRSGYIIDQTARAIGQALASAHGYKIL
jgi:hypothetical protein